AILSINRYVYLTLINPLFDNEEIISPKIDPHYFNAESNLIESLLNCDILIDSSPKFDYILEEFSGELAHIDPIPPGIEKADFDLEEEIRLVENLLYDNSSSRPPEELNLEIVDTIIESPSPSPIPIADSDSLMEEIDLFLASDDSMPPGIENDDYNSEGDICFLEELLSNDSPPLTENESSNLDHFNDPSSSCPPPKPPDVEICFDFEPDTGVLTTKVVKGISEHYVLMPNILPTLPTLDPDLDFFLMIPSDLEKRFSIRGYSLKSNPRDFYHGMNFLSHSSMLLFLQYLTLCIHFHPKTRTKYSILWASLIGGSDNICAGMYKVWRSKNNQGAINDAWEERI
ncbi:hypothetical protein Tco_0479480, partial [Tanacetum coccineum]